MLTGWRAVRLVLRAHHGLACLLVSLLAALATWAAGTTAVPVAPSGVGMDYPAPLWAYLSVVPGLVVAGSRTGTMPAAEMTAARRVPWASAAFLAAAAVVAAVLTGAVLLPGAGAGIALASARNLLFWTGVALLGEWLLTPATGWVLPLAWVFAVEWFGKSANGSPRPWTIVRAAAGNPAGWVVTGFLLCVALWLSCRPSRRSALRAAARLDA